MARAVCTITANNDGGHSQHSEDGYSRAGSTWSAIPTFEPLSWTARPVYEIRHITSLRRLSAPATGSPSVMRILQQFIDYICSTGATSRPELRSSVCARAAPSIPFASSLCQQQQRIGRPSVTNGCSAPWGCWLRTAHPVSSTSVPHR